jgi:DNA-binding response OmpR family regulator
MLVLIIEPDRILAKEYKKAFEGVGIEVVLCSDAQSAIGLVDHQKPDAVIVELQLAGHSGIDFLYEFRSYEDLSRVPLFIYSSVPEYAFDPDKKTWESLGVERYLYKPKVQIDRLVGIVKSKIEK